MEYTDEIEERIVIDSAAIDVWRLLSDLPRMRRWSPAVLRVRVTTSGALGVGTRTRNLNRMGFFVWPTSSEVTTWAPGKELAFRIRENRTVWRFRLDQLDDGGTLVIQRRETPDGINERALELEARHFGSVEKFEAKVRAGMRQTLRTLQAAVEAAV